MAAGLVLRNCSSAAPQGSAIEVSNDPKKKTDGENPRITTNPSRFSRVLAEDYVNLTHDVRIFVLNDKSAVATYVKEYVANENGNVARQDTTDIFIKDGQTWRMRLSRTSPHTSEN